MSRKKSTTTPITMSPDTVLQLNTINRTFYETHAASFAQSRSYYWPSWTSYWERSQWSSYLGKQSRVWDVGCGHARLWWFLHEQGWRGEYLGSDVSHGMLAQAQQLIAAQSKHLPDSAQRQINWQHWDFVQQLVTAKAGASNIPAAEKNNHEIINQLNINTDGKFDIIAVFGVWHHLPSAWLRQQALQFLVSQLQAGGELWLTIWQPTACGRRKPTSVPLAQTTWSEESWVQELEPGDEFLGWGRAPQREQQVAQSAKLTTGQVRYVHWLDAAEEANLFLPNVASGSMSWQRWCETQTGERGNICYLGTKTT